MLEVARTQDEEVGDGTTSVIILGEFHLVEDCGLVLHLSAVDNGSYQPSS